MVARIYLVNQESHLYYLEHNGRTAVIHMPPGTDGAQVIGGRVVYGTSPQPGIH